MLRPHALAALVALTATAAAAQEISPDTVWRLESVDGEPISGEVTLQLGADGAVSGLASCNRYTGQNTATLPEFAVGPMAMTRMACPDMTLETIYIAALQRIIRAERDGERLVLSDDEGNQLVFAPDT